MNVYASAGLAALDVIELLVPEPHEYSSDARHEDRYVYGNRPNDANHYRWADLYVEPDRLVYYFVDSYTESAWDGKRPEYGTTLEIEGGSTPTDDLIISPGSTTSVGSSSVNETWKATDRTLMYSKNDGWTIERIPQEKIELRGRKLGWTRKTIEAYLDGNEPVYFAHEAPIRVVERSEVN